MRTYCVAFIAVALLAGCGALQQAQDDTQPPIGASGTMPQSAIATHGARGGSWMLPEAKSEDLVYVSSIGYIYVFDYPARKLVGAIYDYRYPLGLCSDTKGDVYVTEFSYSQITEYAHGGTIPLRTLSDPQTDPRACAIDRTSGDLAVANYDPGGVVIFPNASGSPQSYAAPVTYPNACAYDGSGNLFVDGGSSGFELAELPSGGSSFESVTLNRSIGNPGDIEWDGKYLALQDYDVPNAIYRFAMSGSEGTLEATVSLVGPVYPPEFGDQFAVHSGKVIMPYVLKNMKAKPSWVGAWDYPAGGALFERHGRFGGRHLFGVTVSIAK